VTTEWRWKSTYNVAREQKDFFPDKESYDQPITVPAMDRNGNALPWLFDNDKKLGNLEKVEDRSIRLHKNNPQSVLQMDDRLFLTLCARELRLGQILDSNYFHEVFKMDKVDCYSDWWKFLALLKRLIEFTAQYGSWYKAAGATPYIRLTPDFFENRVKTFLLQLLRQCKFGNDFNREILQTLNNLQLDALHAS
jgi:hypothetical protein